MKRFTSRRANEIRADWKARASIELEHSEMKAKIDKFTKALTVIRDSDAADARTLRNCARLALK